MRIDAYNKISQVYQTNQVTKTTKAAATKSSDQLEISRTGKDYQVAKQAVANTPDMRTDKINDIKSRIASGNYNISVEEVAKKLVDSYFEPSI
jgi:negative regulator of flagellin synthesis FlgM